MLLWKRYGNNNMAAILHLQQYSHRLNLLYFLFVILYVLPLEDRNYFYARFHAFTTK